MTRERLPEWMRMSSRLDQDENYQAIRKLVDDNHLHTICTSGNCPNIGECWRAGTATFMILGNICTRACRFCGVPTGKPLPPDESEPQRIAESVKTMGLRHAVITSVDRDDLPDKGATCWAQTIRAVKELNPGITMETLIPDFDGIPELIAQVIDAGPEVISHNLETVARLTPQIRSRAKYQTSLKVIKQIAQSGLVAKSGIMLGLGETREEILETMDDLRAVGCTVLTIGQYLQPTRDHMPVSEWITPEEFKFYEEAGLKKGFRHVESSPLVRSSYHAEKHVI
ncbi:MAG: lipoyl synthase [Bacteroidales bacterium]|nr:lipoyl synthase [Bacteroidales bacterium]